MKWDGLHLFFIFGDLCATDTQEIGNTQKDLAVCKEVLAWRQPQYRTTPVIAIQDGVRALRRYRQYRTRSPALVDPQPLFKKIQHFHLLLHSTHNRMSTKDASQEQTIHPKSPADGDIVLYGTDGKGVRFQSYQLKTHRLVQSRLQGLLVLPVLIGSTVFRSMLETTSTSQTVNMPDLRSDHLLELRTAMECHHIPSRIQSGCAGVIDERFFAGCERYDVCHIAAMKVRSLGMTLGSNYAHDAGKYRLELLYRAGQSDCVDVAARIFAHSEDPYYMPNGMPGGEGFDLDAPARLPATWVHAIHAARTEALKVVPSGSGDKEYWVIFAGFFLKVLSGR